MLLPDGERRGTNSGGASVNVRDAHTNLGGVTAGSRVPLRVGVSKARACSFGHEQGKHRRCQTGKLPKKVTSRHTGK